MGTGIKYEAVLLEDTHRRACAFLLCHIKNRQRQEELCFALWRPSRGATRYTALISEIIEPHDAERSLHGNVAFEAAYLSRVLMLAHKKGMGIAFMHSHLTPGWQDMSKTDIIAERDRIAPPVATVGLPLVGLTLGTDECWSARFWIRKNRYQQHWCEKVRIVGARYMDLSYSPEHADISLHRKKLRRTIDTWGMAAQQKMAGLKIGIVGLGSVGSIVAETLARMGMSSLVLIDADRIEKHNLDRLLHANNQDIGRYKVALARQHLRHSGTACKLRVQGHTAWIQQKSCYLSALDCDLLFACVDRPLPKDLLNHIALLHCIPIVFGGVYIHSKANKSLGQATWSTSIVAPGSRCLRCNGQYTSSDVIQERDGSLDAPDYLHNADSNSTGNRNVFPFCANLASLMVMQMIRYLIAEDWWSNRTNMYYNYIPNHCTANETISCESNCSIREKVAMGDQYNYPFIAPDPKLGWQDKISRLFSTR